jgi:multidrug resistance efflux pump
MEEDDLNNSESIQDIIGTNPPFIARWGNTFMLGICTLLVSLCWLIRYPDVIPCNVTIKTNVNPKPATVRIDSKIVKLLCSDGKLVKKGQALAFLESMADIHDVFLLETQLNQIDSFLTVNNWDTLRSMTMVRFNKFGELQNSFESFYISLQTLRAYWSGSISTGKKQIIQNELNTFSNLNRNLNEQKNELLADLHLAEDEYKTNLKLFHDSAISRLELRASESKYISKKLLYKQQESSVLANTNSSLSSSRQMIDMNDQIEQEKINFIRTLGILRNDVNTWKHDFILSAPESGKLSYPGTVLEYQTVTKGQELFYVMPENIVYEGSISLGQYNLGKVESGQAVIIKLKSYPFEEYGVVKGIVDNISEIDVNKEYLVRVQLPDGITTNLNKKLKFRFGMLGEAEIITKNTRIIDKVVYKLKRG